ncbi:MAG: leucyl/phenylalanyl-tRNA--protein transferase [Nitriliruptoraceae bacterium]
MSIKPASLDDPAPHARLRRPRPVLPSMWGLPHPSEADEDGVVGVGADLEPGTLADAYLRGIFPWPHSDMPTPWFSPNPRAVIPAKDINISRSLRSVMRHASWHTTIDTAFSAVMHACAQRDDEPTWITPEMIAAYTRLHDLSWAHSIEVWDGKTLIGGVYGVQLGAVFTAESMFFRRSNASKVALVALCRRFSEAGGVLIDAQIMTPHLASLGAVDLPRATFLAQLTALRGLDVCMRKDAMPVMQLV